MRSVVSIVLVMGSFFVSGPVVRAQAPGPAASDGGAPALTEKARRDRELGRLDEAIDGFARAYQLSGDSSLLFDMAETHREAGRAADALRLFQTYRRRDPKGARRESAEKQIRELERQAQKGKGGGGGDVKAPAPAVSPIGKAPAPAPARPSSAVLPPPVVAAPPAPPPPPPTPPPPVPSPVGVTPPLARTATEPPPVGPPVTADLPAPVITTTTTATTAATGADLSIERAPPPESGRTPLPRWVPWTLAAATVALGTGAIVSGLSASSRYDELTGSCGQTPGGCPTDQINDVKSRALRANVLWALTSVAAVGTGVTLFVNVQAAGASGVWSF